MQLDNKGLLTISAAMVTGYLTFTAAAQCPFSLVVADDGMAGDNLGRRVAISGDTAVAGSNDAVYVFFNSGGAWSQQDEFTAPDIDISPGTYGQAVDIDGDTVVVGATIPGEPGGGAAYVYERVGSVWSLAATLTPSSEVASVGAGFGNAVAVDGQTIVVGAWLDDGEDDRGVTILVCGSAYVFERAGDSWSDQVSAVKLLPSDLESQDHFGVSVDIDGTRIVVGANENGDGAGAAYVYDRPGETWSSMSMETARLAADDEIAGDAFGGAVAVSGDTAIVGARYDDNAMGSDAGAAYVYFKAPAGWSQQAKLLTTNTNVSAGEFANDVDLVGDTAVVGEWLVNHLAPSPYFLVIGGSAHVFERSGTTWSHEYELAAFDPDNFTMTERVESLAFDGTSLIVGSPLHDWWAADSGATFVHGGVGADCNGNGVPDGCDIFEGTSLDDDGDGVPDECGCPADLTGDGEVGTADLLDLLAAWGTPDGDLDGDGTTSTADLLALLGAWGPC